MADFPSQITRSALFLLGVCQLCTYYAVFFCHHLWKMMAKCCFFSIPITNSPILWHQLDVLQFYSILTLTIQSQQRPDKIRLQFHKTISTSETIYKWGPGPPAHLPGQLHIQGFPWPTHPLRFDNWLEWLTELRKAEPRVPGHESLFISPISCVGNRLQLHDFPWIPNGRIK